MIAFEELSKRVEEIVISNSEEEFIYDFLLAFEFPKSSISRLKNGSYDELNEKNKVLWKKNLLFNRTEDDDVHSTIDNLIKDVNALKTKPRFIIVTNFKTFLSVDTKTNFTLDIEFKNLSNHAEFFLPWTGQEKSILSNENPADIKAALRMGQLYDIVVEDNGYLEESEESKHTLNVFFTRLLFCFFAEDAGIFEENQFIKSIDSHTKNDGSDLKEYLEEMFVSFNVEDRSEVPNYFLSFPYVNGNLFNEIVPIPKLSKKARDIIISSGELDWVSINPDILGSMMQAVIDPEERSEDGVHYTSVSNIMKLIGPLFLDSFKEDLNLAGNNEKKLRELLNRLYNTIVFDPACGSGNFLVISYKELCKIEIEIFKKLQALSFGWNLAVSGIKLSQFYGIEIDDFRHEAAKVSLWLAKHQMNLEFEDVFGEAEPALPLVNITSIVKGNALRLSWQEICPISNEHAYHVVGNPPYAGSRNQKSWHKEDLEYVFKGIKDFKKLDYVSAWLYLGKKHIENKNANLAFVCTNSISQGEQVPILWPNIIDDQTELNFVHKSFIWKNNARSNAGVSVIIVGLGRGKKDKYIYEENKFTKVDNITPYLTPGENTFVFKEDRPISKLPVMIYGNEPRENGNLLLTRDEKAVLLSESPELEPYIKKVSGSNELINNIERYCLFDVDDSLLKIENTNIKNRLDNVKKYRENNSRKGTRDYASRPSLFTSITYKEKNALVIPIVSSENREYIPFGFVDKDVIVLNSAQVVYVDSDIYILSVISSKMHMLWTKLLAGRLRSDIRYSSQFCYNTFPFPPISSSQENYLEELAFNLIDEREKYPEMNLGQIYSINKMPAGLKKAHENIDLFVEACYSKKVFNADDERLNHLLTLYSSMKEN